MAARPPRLLDQVTEAVRTRGMSPRTAKAYRGWVRRYVLYHRSQRPVPAWKRLAAAGVRPDCREVTPASFADATGCSLPRRCGTASRWVQHVARSGSVFSSPRDLRLFAHTQAGSLSRPDAPRWRLSCRTRA
ncbi:MAG: phage integrase N-terminal SAM-like domain-containing protein [Polyangiaceae bacterium]|nr:phage integrase N-terminal SAM-like domain-containing protein [Polyangiaceae bacterium]